MKLDCKLGSWLSSPLQQLGLKAQQMVNMLGNSYYKRGYGRKNIITILDSVGRFSKYRSPAVAALNMINYLTKLETGYPAPEIQFTRGNGDNVNWTTYKGKFIYVNFFASWNESSVTEMKLLHDLNVKYGDYVSFLSFCTDKNKSDFDEYIQNNSNFDWDIVYLGDDHDLLKQFNVNTVPSYYLVDQEGFMALSPARGPAPDGVYKSIEETFFYIKTEMEKPKTR
jgi:hypothetical protein